MATAFAGAFAAADFVGPLLFEAGLFEPGLFESALFVVVVDFAGGAVFALGDAFGATDFV